MSGASHHRTSPTNQLRFSDPSSTCDPFIDEHFRRSLGTDYDLILRNKAEQEQLALQKQRVLEEQLMIQKQQQQQQATVMQAQQQQNILKLTHHKKHQIHQHQAMMAAKHSQAIATPPTTPSPPTLVPLPASVQPSAQQPGQVIITEHSSADEMSVDDHFAKALGDTWKQIQNEGKWVGPSNGRLSFLSHSVAIWRFFSFFKLLDGSFTIYNYFRHFF